jgi:hypothetical protein
MWYSQTDGSVILRMRFAFLLTKTRIQTHILGICNTWTYCFRAASMVIEKCSVLHYTPVAYLVK